MCVCVCACVCACVCVCVRARDGVRRENAGARHVRRGYGRGKSLGPGQRCGQRSLQANGRRCIQGYRTVRRDRCMTGDVVRTERRDLPTQGPHAPQELFKMGKNTDTFRPSGRIERTGNRRIGRISLPNPWLYPLYAFGPLEIQARLSEARAGGGAGGEITRDWWGARTLSTPRNTAVFCAALWSTAFLTRLRKPRSRTVRIPPPALWLFFDNTRGDRGDRGVSSCEPGVGG